MGGKWQFSELEIVLGRLMGLLNCLNNLIVNHLDFERLIEQES